jgi:hypothetical protein
LTLAWAAAKIAAMSIHLQLRFRAFMAALSGVVLLLESVYAVFFRAHFDAWSTLVNFFIFLFGAAFLLQSRRLAKQLREQVRSEQSGVEASRREQSRVIPPYLI